MASGAVLSDRSQTRRAEFTARRDARLGAAFSRAERSGRRLATGARLAAVAAVILWLLYQTPGWSAAYYAGLAFGFAVLGYIQLWLSERGADGRFAIGG